MRQDAHDLVISTRGPGLHEFTREARDFVRDSGIVTGLFTAYVQHTSASLLIQENADPEVQRDLERFFRRLVPDGDPRFRHVSEGPDDMSAHVKAALTATTLTVPVRGGSLALGTWQGLYLYEHRTRPHRRSVLMSAIGE